MSARLRWQIADLLNRLPGQCWADLALWAAHGQRRLPWSPIGWSCRSDLSRNGSCYCNKIQREPASASAEEVSRGRWANWGQLRRSIRDEL